jgi:hypothetical protein
LVLRQLLASAQPQGAKEMTREDIIRMAREAGIRDCTCNGEFGCLERFEALVRADERKAIYDLVMEAPFKEFDRQEEDFDGEAANAMKAMAFSLTTAIRARGQA